MSSVTAAPELPGTRVPCAADPERMFPVDESSWAGQEPTVGERSALAVCARCPVLARCRDAVLTVAPLSHGVVGGMTAMQRRTARSARRSVAIVASSMASVSVSVSVRGAA